MVRKRISIMALAALLVTGARAHALQCPGGMTPVDDAFCMDVYEYPNIQGSLPLNQVTWADAAHQCEAEGKRLCTAAELHLACSGDAGRAYPYGNDFQSAACSAGERKRAGAAAGCAGSNGIQDLSGNLAEWTADGATVHGGSYARAGAADLACGATAPAGAAAADVGFRCCAGPVMQYAEIPEPRAAAPAQPESAVEQNIDPGPTVKQAILADPAEAAPEKPLVVETAPAPDRVEVRRNVTRKRRVWEQPDLPARAVVSPLTRYTPGHARKGFYASAQYHDLGNTFDSTSLKTQVSAWAWALTVGYQFDNKLNIEGTAIEHKIETSKSGVWTSRKDTDYVWHASYGIADLFEGEMWPGDLVVGARRFDNSVGQATELYVAKEFTHGHWVLTPAVNYITRSAREDKAGLSLDVRYYVTPYFNVFGNYNSQDYYKTIVNDYLAPSTSLGALARCPDCSEHSASLGMDYGVLKEQGGLFFQVYDVGDLNAPMGGLYFNF